MPRIYRGEFLEFDPDIERTFRERRRAQRALFALHPPEMAQPNQDPQGLLEAPQQPPPQPPPYGVQPPYGQPQQQPQIQPLFGPQQPPLIGNPPEVPFHNMPEHLYEDEYVVDDDESQHNHRQGNNNNNNEQRVPPPNIVHLANSKDGRIMDYAIPNFDQLNSGIARPHFPATHFEPKPIMFHMLQTNGQFAGLATEDPHSHLKSFLEVSDCFKIPGVPNDALRLTLFPFSLRDRAREWFNSLAPGSVTSWNEMAEKFLRKYFPPTRNAKS